MTNLLGSYHLVEQIGSGATGRVWRARHADTGALFAIKELRSDLADDREVRSRFLNEEAILTKRHLPGVVRVHGTVVDGDRLGLVMDLIEGPDLREVIASSAPMPPARSCLLIGQLAETLAAAHASGLIHRDVKPANVMLLHDNADQGALLTDFGLARVLEETGSTASRSQALGTPDYVAPEVLQDGRAGGPADVYALGVMLYEMTAGWRPFRRRSLAALMTQHLTETPERPPGIDDKLWQVISACLEKAPKARPTAGVLSTQLSALAAQLVEVPALPRTDPPEQLEKTHLKLVPPSPNVKPSRLSMSSRAQRIIAASFVGLVAVAVTAYAASGSATRADDPDGAAPMASTTVEPAAPTSAAVPSPGQFSPLATATPQVTNSGPTSSGGRTNGGTKTTGGTKTASETRTTGETKTTDRTSTAGADETRTTGSTRTTGKAKASGGTKTADKTKTNGNTKTKTNSKAKTKTNSGTKTTGRTKTNSKTKTTTRKGPYVSTRGGTLNEHVSPKVSSKVIRRIANGDEIALACWTTGDGHRWDKSSKRGGYLLAENIVNDAGLSKCKGTPKQPAKSKAPRVATRGGTLNEHVSAKVSSKVIRRIANGDEIALTCWTNGDGHRWDKSAKRGGYLLAENIVNDGDLPKC